MNLDDQQTLQALDVQGLLAHFDALPAQFSAGWAWGKAQVAPPQLPQIQQIVFCGMGLSGIAGELWAKLLPLPLHLLQDYHLPPTLQNPHTLLIFLSYSGETEEILSLYRQLDSASPALVLTSGGTLAAEVRSQAQHHLWQLPGELPPQAMMGWLLGALLGLAQQAGWLQYEDADIAALQQHLAAQQRQYQASVAAMHNPAKRQAGQLIGRIPVIYGAGVFAPLARYWKLMLNELAGTAAFAETLPDANHHSIAGAQFPEELLPRLLMLFITAPQQEHPRISLRHDLSFQHFMLNGIAVDRFMPQGAGLLQQVLHSLQFGNYLSFYTAIAYGVEPGLSSTVESFKNELSQSFKEN